VDTALVQELPPLPKAIGVCRDVGSPGQKTVLVAFERQLSDDELRSLHDRLRASYKGVEPKPHFDHLDKPAETSTDTSLDAALQELADQAQELDMGYETVGTANTLAGFKGGYWATHDGTHPTEQEIWNAGVASGIRRAAQSSSPLPNTEEKPNV
jgi:hypothetical protein